MAHGLTVFETPVFCLGGTIYPVDTQFDWTHDSDVLVDAVRETYRAVRMHAIAARTPDRSWLVCECVDVARHRDLLAEGHALLLATVLALEPDAPRTRARELPVAAMFMRMVQVVAIAVGSMTLLPDLF